jgi:hypothetical protein
VAVPETAPETVAEEKPPEVIAEGGSEIEAVEPLEGEVAPGDAAVDSEKVDDDEQQPEIEATPEVVEEPKTAEDEPSEAEPQEKDEAVKLEEAKEEKAEESVKIETSEAPAEPEE